MHKENTKNSIPANMTRSIKRICDLYKELGLFKGQMPFKGQTSSETKSVRKKNSLVETYKTAIQMLDYDIILKDDSIFHFTFDNNSDRRLVFLQSPYKHSPFLDFLHENFNEDDIPSDPAEINVLKDTLSEDYTQWLTELGLNMNSVYMRYDLDLKDYKPNLHAYAHLHIGFGNNIRIPCNKYLTPLSFSLLVLKHIYKKEWEKALNDDNIKKRIFNIPKGKLIENEHWNIEETNDFYLI